MQELARGKYRERLRSARENIDNEGAIESRETGARNRSR
jgi:hypothetical protein